MKVVKLNRRFRQFRDHGHTVALKFVDGHMPKATAIEKACRERLTGHGWLRDNDWYSYYGESNRRTSTRPYWITFRRQTDLTFVILCADLTKNS